MRNELGKKTKKKNIKYVRKIIKMKTKKTGKEKNNV